jgi:proline dehydrogenase
MEKERDRAEEGSYPSPIHKDKNATDKCFNDCLRYIVKNIKDFQLCNGTHNEESTYLLVELMQSHNIKKDDPRIFSAQLMGMSDHISYNLSHEGYNVAKYVPFGPVREMMPYLIRRAQENSSAQGQTGRELRLISHELKERKNDRRKGERKAEMGSELAKKDMGE